MSWPLTGRERELRAVGDALASGTAGGAVIVGAAGVGKTRLAVEAAELAAAQGCEVAWARASRSARSIPLGAFAALLPPAGDGVELLSRARQALAERAAGRRLVLCVDDGQLLDDASAALVHQLVAGREAFAIVGLRLDEPAPDALRALWKDDLCVRLDLAALSEATSWRCSTLRSGVRSTARARTLCGRRRAGTRCSCASSSATAARAGC